MATIILGKKKKEAVKAKAKASEKTKSTNSKVKVKLPVSEESDNELDLEYLAFRLGEIDKELAPMKALMVEKSKLEDSIRDYYNNTLDPDEAEEHQGPNYSIKVGKIPSKRKIVDMHKVKKFMGVEGFMKVATVTLKNIDDYLNPEEKEEVLETVREGKRPLKVEFF